MITKGTNQINKIALGANEIGRIYLGNGIVYGGEVVNPLPDGAIPCDYIYSNGYSAFIDSGIVPSSAMSFDIDTILVKNSSATAFGIGYYINNIRYAPIGFASNGTFELGYNGYHDFSSSTKLSTAGYYRRRYRISVNGTGSSLEIYKDGLLEHSESISYSESSASFSSTYTLGLLGRKTSQTAITSGVWRGGFGEMIFYGDDNFGEVVAHFLPCYYNNSFGFWDTVSKTFKAGDSNIFGFGEAFGTQGFIPNCRNNTSHAASDYTIDYRGDDLTRMFEIPEGCVKMRFNGGTTGGGSSDYKLMFFNAEKRYVGYWNYTTDDREVAVQSIGTSKYVRLGYTRSQKSNCYIYDVTNGEYIWNGNNS